MNLRTRQTICAHRETQNKQIMMKKVGWLSKESLPGVFNTNLSSKPFQLVLA